jgi:tetratricopeptide (TPR) repeat protein
MAAGLIRGISEFFVGRLDASFESLSICVRLYDPVRHKRHAYEFGQDPCTVALAYLSWVAWLKGDRKAALDFEERALAQGRRVQHPFSLSFALSLAAWLHLYAEDYEGSERHNREDLTLCTDQEIQVFLAHAWVTEGLLTSAAGRAVDGQARAQAGLDFFRATGSRCFLPYWETLKAKAIAEAGDRHSAVCVVEDALSEMARSGEGWAEAEIHRVLGVLREDEDPDAAERCFRMALQIAQRQGAKVFERRTRVSLARLLALRGKRSEALTLREEVLSEPPDDPTDPERIRALGLVC